MHFFSDNAAPAHGAVLEALTRANPADAGYDGDALSRSLSGAFSALFGREVAAFWVTTGTAANALALAALTPPHGGVFCHRDAHINCDEAGAPEFYTHGAKLIPLDGPGAKLVPETVRAARAAIARDVHRVQPHALSITNATEYGQVYTPDEIAALAETARAEGLALHMDGARFANAVARLGCHPAECSWRAGVDVLSFGFVKNGGLSAEALIFFDPERAGATRVRIKRAGHLASKGRFQAAQILALLEEERWLENARAANAAADHLGAAAGARLLLPVEANELFVRVTAEEAARLRAQGFGFYDWAEGEIRLVTAWHHRPEDVAPLAAALRAL
ncbi:threonine aldolase family protein [Sphingomonas morindae]|uniref:Low specificity L-threonine aldolase n=1 Tax=Sphingomonas morindae TaxID=1541170 RepID=A0ABY4X466_9SPHN|nr:beta-eliminating lyase-related protein [Sphingomonas morindae]USI71692.1 low specificity L-threonine aldolase [Sphingomonas morindae]